MRVADMLGEHPRTVTATGALALLTAGAFGVGAGAAVHAKETEALPVTAVRPVTGWSEVLDGAEVGPAAGMRFRVVEVAGACLVQAVAEDGRGKPSLAPVDCP